MKITNYLIALLTLSSFASSQTNSEINKCYNPDFDNLQFVFCEVDYFQKENDKLLSTIKNTNEIFNQKINEFFFADNLDQLESELEKNFKIVEATSKEIVKNLRIQKSWAKIIVIERTSRSTKEIYEGFLKWLNEESDSEKKVIVLKQFNNFLEQAKEELENFSK